MEIDIILSPNFYYDTIFLLISSCDNDDIFLNHLPPLLLFRFLQKSVEMCSILPKILTSDKSLIMVPFFFTFTVLSLFPNVDGRPGIKGNKKM